MHFRKALFVSVYDILAVALSLIISLYLRVGGDSISYVEVMNVSVPLYMAICAVMFYYFKIAFRVWKYTSIEDIFAIIKAVSLAIVVFLPIMFAYNRLEGMPRSLMIIDWFVLNSLLIAPRFFFRMFSERTLNIDINSRSSLAKINVILVGITEHSEQFLRSIVSNKGSEYRIIALIDEDPAKQGKYIRNVKVYGNIKQLRNAIEALNVTGKTAQKVIIAPDVFNGEEVQQILDVTDKLGLTLSRLPRVTDFSQPTDKIPLRNIMLEDLLGRPQTALDKELMNKFISGKRILVTGAGGSIGSELVRQIAGFNPSHISLFDISEYNLYEIDLEIGKKFPDISKRPIIGDVRDSKNLKLVFEHEMPHVVFHAAALKHVPMSEANASETALTNICGTRNVADVCVSTNVEEMVMISTDKAVNPSNVMGATKRMAESYVQALGNSKKAKNVRFVTIRFGNVLGSTGSVIPLFKRQIEQGGPITVTHPEIKRYFMTIREAVELVIEAGAIDYNSGDEESKIFVLDMGDPVLIIDLAKQLIRLSGLRIEQDIKIEFTGLRPGEKLFEELFHNDENTIPTQHAAIMLANPRQEPLANVNKAIKKIENAANTRNDNKVIELLHESLPEFV